MGFRYFADLNDGSTLEWRDRKVRIGQDRAGAPLYRIDQAKVRGVYNKRGMVIGYEGWTGESWIAITRTVQFKSNPSLHVCNAKCQSAKGHQCECSCGGKNHGRSAFMCEAA